MKQHLKRLDLFARERTLLANERTLLAHWRTGFAAFIFGLGLVQLTTVVWLGNLGLGFLGMGVLFFVVGAVTYVVRDKRIKSH